MIPTLTLELVAIHDVRGIYGPGKDELPERMRFLQPEAAASFERDLAHVVTVSDMFRSPESSLQAVREGRGAKAPGFSAHNYGLGIDIDIRKTIAGINRAGFDGVKTKTHLDDWMAKRGWICHRSDHAAESWKPRANEAWHFNFLGTGHRWGVSSPGAVEQRISTLYGEALTLSPAETQGALKTLRVYSGAVDGQIGPLTRTAIRAFQRTWGLGDTGTPDVKTQRTLAYVTCARSVS